eukprot:scaffold21034_cov63-Phaeocystis_antarctica.AAC.1
MGGTGSHTDILKTMGNGVPAVNAGSVATGFKDGGGQSITDCEFVEDGTHNIAIFAATTDNFVVLADMRATAAWNGVGTPPAIPSRKIDLHTLSSSDVTDDYKTNAESSSGHGRGAVRSIVWAPGSNMVMVNSGKTKELHLITLSADGGIEGAALTKTIAGAESRYMVFVDNHDVRAKTRAMDAKIATAKATMESLAGPAGPAGPSGAAGTNGLAGTAGAAGKAAPAALADMGASSQEVSDSSSDEAKTMAAAGLVLGALGFLFGAASLGVTLMRGGSRKSVAREVSFGKDKGGITEAKA